MTIRCTRELSPEICDHIIDCLTGEMQTLRNCCLTSRHWVARSRYNMMRIIKLSNNQQLQSLAAVEAWKPYSKCLRELHIDENEHHYAHAVPLRLCKFISGVEVLHLSSIRWDKNPIQTSLLMTMNHFQSVQTLSLDSCVFANLHEFMRIVCELPRLNDLRLSRCDAIVSPFQRSSLSPHADVALRTSPPPQHCNATAQDSPQVQSSPSRCEYLPRNQTPSHLTDLRPPKISRAEIRLCSRSFSDAVLCWLLKTSTRDFLRDLEVSTVFNLRTLTGHLAGMGLPLELDFQHHPACATSHHGGVPPCAVSKLAHADSLASLYPRTQAGTAKPIFNHQWYAVSEHARSAASGSEGLAMEWSWRADFVLLSRRLECWTEGTFHRDSPVVCTLPHECHPPKVLSRRSHTI